MNISPLTLGTVQLGLDYGIANQSGQPSSTNSNLILRSALENGITTLDTSRNYGVAETVIGEFLASATHLPSWPLIGSKFKWSTGALRDFGQARREAKDSVKQSLQALGLPVLPLLLYHKAMDEPIDSVLQFLPKILHELCEEGMIEKGGISLYYPDEVFSVVDEVYIDAIQTPVSIFDQRIINNGGLGLLADRGIVVFARSVFLQGLFFMDPSVLPVKLKPATGYLQRLHQLAKTAAMDVDQFAFTYVRDLIGVDSIVFGAEHPDQVIKTARLLKTTSIAPDLREEVDQAFANIPQQIITPGLW